MNLSSDPKARAKEVQAIRALAGTSPAAFKVFMEWFESELKRRDEENRAIGNENKSSEAQCQADFIRIVAACLAPVTDRNPTETGAEGVSASNLM